MHRLLKQLLVTLFFTFLSIHHYAQDCVTFYMDTQQAEVGDTVKVDVRVRDFYDVLVILFEMEFSNTSLEFLQVEDFNLPFLTASNFLLEEGNRIRFYWENYENDGIIVQDGSSIFSLAFRVLAIPPEGASIKFDNPLNSFETSRNTPLGTVYLSTSYLHGYIYSTDSPLSEYPSIEMACAHGPNCNNGADAGTYIDIEVTGGASSFTYEWLHHSGNTYNTPNLSDLPRGRYNLTITDNNGKQTQAYFVVVPYDSYNNNPEVAKPSCLNGDDGRIELLSQQISSEYSFEWNTGDTTVLLENLLPGTYTVTVSSPTGCSIKESFSLDQNQYLDVAVAKQNPTCNQNNGYIDLILPDPNLNYTFQWNHGSNTEDIYNLIGNFYRVTVTETSTDCETEKWIPLYDTPFTYDVFTDCQITDNDQANLNMDIGVWSGGIPPYTFEWSNGHSESSHGYSSSSISVPADEIGAYSVTVEDQTGCIFGPVVFEPECTAIDPNLINFSINSTETDVNESFCLDIRVKNFTEMLGFQFSINWNPEVIQFESIQNVNLPGFAPYSFATPNTGTAPGTMAAAWLFPGLNPVTVDDGTVIFQLCFKALQAGATQVFVSGEPTLIEVIDINYVPLDYSLSPGLVVVNGQSTAHNLILNANEATVQEGESVCFDVTTNQANGLADLQFNLEWDTAYLQFETVQNYNLPGLSTANFGTMQDWAAGQIHFYWEDENDVGIELLQGQSLFELCLTATDGPATVPVYFSNDPLPIEASHISTDSFNIFTINGNIVILSDNTPPIQLTIDDQIGIPEQEVCLPVYTKNFADIGAMQFSLDWYENELAYSTIHLADLTGLDFNDFDFSQTGNGQLAVDWASSTSGGASLPDSSILFEVCFLPIGSPGVKPIEFSNIPVAIQFQDNLNNSIAFVGLAGNVIIPAALVWPGDTDDNQLVDHFDLLNIGLAFGATGPVRENASLEWAAQYTAPWANQTPESAINFRHADTDGNGIVNANDTLAIVQNWGEESGIWASQEERNSIPIYIQPDTLLAGSTGRFNIMLGDEDNPLEEAYGLAFSIHYDPYIIIANTAKVNLVDSWFGDLNLDKIGLFRNDSGNNRIEVAITRTDQINRNGFGKIGSLVLDFFDIPLPEEGYELEFNIENVRLINVEEQDINLTPLSTTSLLQNQNTTSTASPHQTAVQIFPVPTQDKIFIKSDFQIREVSLYSIQGQRLISRQAMMQEIKLEQLPNGVYLLQVIDEQGIHNFKVKKQL